MKWDYHFGVNKPYQEVEDGFVPALQDFYDHPDKYALAPFQIFGNLWYVGEAGGTNWTMFQKGPEKLGLVSKEIPLHAGTIANYVKKGIPVVINVGPGDFTLHGHYMVIVGYEDEKFKINDPFSVENSNKLWSYEKLEGQIKNLWAISLPEESAEG